MTENSPFTHALIDSGYKKNLMKFDGIEPGGVNYVVRGYETIPKSENQDGAAITELEQRRDILSERLVDLKKQGIKVAPTYFQIGDNNYGNPSLFIATREIEGKNTFDSNFSDPEKTKEVLPKFEGLMTSLTNYFGQQIDSGEPLLDDIDSLRQYIFGVVEEGDEPDFILVDTEPRAKNPTNNSELIAIVGKLQLMVEGMETRLAEGTSLPISRQSVAKLIELMSTKYPETSERLSKVQSELLEGINGIQQGIRSEKSVGGNDDYSLHLSNKIIKKPSMDYSKGYK